MNARWFGLWWGGSGYGRPTDEDLEEFASLEEARAKLLERYAHGHWLRSEFRYVHRDGPAQVLCPCVSEDTEILLYGSATDLDYPDRRVFLGARGGARVERC
ncbi:hypothetical protein [Planobispora rosea]|uniref:hypothetical protein n=1 Tax=Planobispora rosea TaxID=35762 RepID=UPI00083B6CD4|nr:hypothetical protein [Planobispora rosea]